MIVRTATLLLLAVVLFGADAPPTFRSKPDVAGDMPLVLKDDFERDDFGNLFFITRVACRQPFAHERGVLPDQTDIKHRGSKRQRGSK